MKAVSLHRGRRDPNKPNEPQHAVGTPPPAIGTPNPEAQAGKRKPYPDDGLTGRVEAVPDGERATQTFVSGWLRPE